MSILGVRSLLFRAAVFLSCLSLAAQSASFHIEFEDLAEHTPSYSGIFFVNDTNKPIEAFSYYFRCSPNSGGGTRIDSLEDNIGIPLNDLGKSDWTPTPLFIGLHGRYPIGGCEIQHGRASAHFTGDEHHYPEVRVEAVLFSDGSYEGSEEVVRAMEAERDGVEAAVHYWTDRVSLENPNGIIDLSSLHAEANRLAAEDVVMQGKYEKAHLGDAERPLHAYWMGRHWVDVSLPGDTLQLFRVYIARWAQTIDSDVALKKLKALFPPVSDPTVDLMNVARQR